MYFLHVAINKRYIVPDGFELDAAKGGSLKMCKQDHILPKHVFQPQYILTV